MSEPILRGVIEAVIRRHVRPHTYQSVMPNGQTYTALGLGLLGVDEAAEEIRAALAKQGERDAGQG